MITPKNTTDLKEALEGLKAFINRMDIDGITEANTQRVLKSLKTDLNNPVSISALLESDLKSLAEKINPTLAQLDSVIDHLASELTSVLKPLAKNVKSAVTDFLKPEKKEDPDQKKEDDISDAAKNRAAKQVEQIITKEYEKADDRINKKLNPGWRATLPHVGTAAASIILTALFMKGCSNGPDKREEQRLANELAAETNKVATLTKKLDEMGMAPPFNYYRDVMLKSVDSANLGNQNLIAPVAYLTGQPKEKLQEDLRRIGVNSLMAPPSDTIIFFSNKSWVNGRVAVIAENVVQSPGGVKALTNAVGIVAADLRNPAIGSEQKNISYRFSKGAAGTNGVSELRIERDIGAVKTNIVQIGSVPIVE